MLLPSAGGASWLAIAPTRRFAASDIVFGLVPSYVFGIIPRLPLGHENQHNSRSILPFNVLGREEEVELIAPSLSAVTRGEVLVGRGHLFNLGLNS